MDGERYHLMHLVTYVVVELKRLVKKVERGCGFNTTEGKRF